MAPTTIDGEERLPIDIDFIVSSTSLLPSRKPEEIRLFEYTEDLGKSIRVKFSDQVWGILQNCNTWVPVDLGVIYRTTGNYGLLFYPVALTLNRRRGFLFGEVVDGEYQYRLKKSSFTTWWAGSYDSSKASSLNIESIGFP